MFSLYVPTTRTVKVVRRLRQRRGSRALALDLAVNGFNVERPAVRPLHACDGVGLARDFDHARFVPSGDAPVWT